MPLRAFHALGARPLLLIRKIHAYVGLLIAPSVLFFALTGGLQLFSLHEAHDSYRPPKILVTLGNLHKDQVLSKPGRPHGPPPSAAPAPEKAGPAAAPEHDDDAPKIKTYVLKWVFALVAIGLLFSTCLGLWIGLRFTRTPLLSWGLLAVGAAIPVLVLLL